MHTSTGTTGQSHDLMRAMSDSWERIVKRFNHENLVGIVLGLLVLGLYGFLHFSLLRAVQHYQIIGPGYF